MSYTLFSPNAKAMVIRFSEFNLPEGSILTIEDDTTDQVYDRYSGFFTKESESLFDSRPILRNNSIVIKLIVKKNNINDCVIKIGAIGQSFTDWFIKSYLKSVQECTFDVACYSGYTNWMPFTMGYGMRDPGALGIPYI